MRERTQNIARTRRGPAAAWAGAAGLGLTAALIAAAPATAAIASLVTGKAAGEPDHRPWRRLAGLPVAAPVAAPPAVAPPAVAPPAVAAPARVPVPALAGQPVAGAGAALGRAGLKWRQQAEPSDTATAGRVIGTLPAAGEPVEKGSTVTLIVAAPVKVAMPEIVGQTAGEAAAALSRVGLKWRRREQSTTKAAPGRVIGTTPAAGQSVDKGAAVTLVVAKAPTPVYREPVVRTPAYQPTAAFPSAQRPYIPPPGTASAALPAPRPSPPPGPAAAPAALSGDALIQHLYDNAHRSD